MLSNIVEMLSILKCAVCIELIELQNCKEYEVCLQETIP